MAFPERFSNLPEHVWPRIRGLFDVHPAGGDVINMTIGEPRHAFPDWVGTDMAKHAAGFGKYPPNYGSDELLDSIAGWIDRRFGVRVDASQQIMALNGTREGLFNACVALSPETKNGTKPEVLLPNPYYSVYAIGALASTADPIFVPSTPMSGFLPDFASLDETTLNRTTVAYICSPSNPEGAIADRAYWKVVFGLAEKHDFKIFADECYSEIYRDEPPLGALQMAAELGADPERVLVFHSLSKRSNLPGLRSGFVAGGPKSIAKVKELRAYAGAPLPLPIQKVSARLWDDEEHVIASRKLYQEKYKIADQVFAGANGYTPPAGGFFLWLNVQDGEAAALRLWQETGIRVVPGGYFAVEVDGKNPASEYIRVAMVTEKQELHRALTTLRDCLMG